MRRFVGSRRLGRAPPHRPGQRPQRLQPLRGPLRRLALHRLDHDGRLVQSSTDTNPIQSPAAGYPPVSPGRGPLRGGQGSVGGALRVGGRPLAGLRRRRGHALPRLRAVRSGLCSRPVSRLPRCLGDGLRAHGRGRGGGRRVPPARWSWRRPWETRSGPTPTSTLSCPGVVGRAIGPGHRSRSSIPAQPSGSSATRCSPFSMPRGCSPTSAPSCSFPGSTTPASRTTPASGGEPEDGAGLERLTRHIMRPPLSLERMRWC